MCQQALTLGVTCEEGFVPMDSELFISQVKAQPLQQSFQDGRVVQWQSVIVLHKTKASRRWLLA